MAGNSGNIFERFAPVVAMARNFTQGNLAPRIGTIRTPGPNNINLVLAKTFALTERVKLDFRASQYNLLNHPVFGSEYDGGRGRIRNVEHSGEQRAADRVPREDRVLIDERGNGGG